MPFPGKHGVGEGEQGVDRIARRTAVATHEIEAERRIVIPLDEIGEVLEITPGGNALDAQKFFQGAGALGVLDILLEGAEKVFGDA